MNPFLNNMALHLNKIGSAFCDYMADVFVQSSVLIIVLFLVDLVLRKKIRAVVRYSLWLLVLIKLILPPTLTLPTGIGYWCKDLSATTQHANRQRAQQSKPVYTIPNSMQMASGAKDRLSNSPFDPGKPERAVTSLPVTKRAQLSGKAALFLIWLGGMIAFLMVLFHRMRFARGLVNTGQSAPEAWRALLDTCRQQLHIRSEVRLKTSATIPSPAVCGLHKPTILIPTVLVESLSPAEIKATLVHELAHIKRGDLWINALQTLLEVIYFYHPLVWLANAKIRKICEQAVDETVLVALGGQVEYYTNTLINIGEMAFWKADCGLRLLGVAESKRALEWRIKHMLSQPIPTDARIGVRGLLALIGTGAVLLPMAFAQQHSTLDESNYHVLVLADSDPVYDGKRSYDDRLYMLDSQGKIEAVLSGFNTCDSVGGSHRLAIDEKRKTLWVTENVGTHLWQFDLRTGKLIHKLPDLKANGIAVDPDTGNVWVLISEGTLGSGHIKVISPAGQILAQHAISGIDIVYSKYDRSFWVVEENVYHLDTSGKTLGEITGQIPWTASSVSVDETTGHAWIVIRDHSEVPNSRPELWAVDKHMAIRHKIDLGDMHPGCVSVDSQRETVWVGCYSVALRFNTRGEKLKTARWVRGRTLVAGLPQDSIFVGGLHRLVRATKNNPRTETQWKPMPIWENQRNLQAINNSLGLAIIPFAKAKLESSVQLTQVINKQNTTPRDILEITRTLNELGRCLVMHAIDHDDNLPDDLNTLDKFSDIKREQRQWIMEHVEYTGKGVTMDAEPTKIIAYDKSRSAQSQGTFVLHLDGSVSVSGLDRDLIVNQNVESASTAEITNASTDKQKDVTQTGLGIITAKLPIDLSTPEATIKGFVKAVYNGNLEAARARVSRNGHDYDEFKEMLTTESNHPFQAMIKAMDVSVPVEITSKSIKDGKCKLSWYFILGRVYYFGNAKTKKGTHQEFSSYLELVDDRWLIRDI